MNTILLRNIDTLNIVIKPIIIIIIIAPGTILAMMYQQYYI